MSDWISVSVGGWLTCSGSACDTKHLSQHMNLSFSLKIFLNVCTKLCEEQMLKQRNKKVLTFCKLELQKCVAKFRSVFHFAQSELGKSIWPILLPTQTIL